MSEHSTEASSTTSAKARISLQGTHLTQLLRSLQAYASTSSDEINKKKLTEAWHEWETYMTSSEVWGGRTTARGECLDIMAEGRKAEIVQLGGYTLGKALFLFGVEGGWDAATERTKWLLDVVREVEDGISLGSHIRVWSQGRDSKFPSTTAVLKNIKAAAQ